MRFNLVLTQKLTMATNKPSVEQMPSQPPLASHDSSVLDLAFAMDCTGSMSSYIENARNNIRNIVEEIVSSEKSDVRLALVEYRDHPPEDLTFITRPHDFTGSVSSMKGWLDQCCATGGGDKPEAVADALQDVLKLSWREESTKICVLISDAPPHGLVASADGFPDGCPLGLDPMTIVRQLAEKGVTLYCVGCEPAINSYKEFFTAMAYLTGGQYVPLSAAKLLTQVIICGAQEELSLDRWMAQVDEEVRREMAAGREVDEEVMSKRVGEILKAKGARGKQLMRNAQALESASAGSRLLSECGHMRAVKANFKPAAPPAPTAMFPSPAMFSSPGLMASGPPPGSAMLSEDVYEAVASEITEGQAYRMVQKSKARNKIFFSK